jgi:hypothetical protein
MNHRPNPRVPPWDQHSLPGLIAPHRPPRSHTLWVGISCSPGVNAYNDRRSSCGDNVCMKRITVDEVFDVVCRLYEEGGREAATV